MFHKITFCLNEKTFEKNKIIELFENVVFEKKKKKWKVLVISNDYQRDVRFLNCFLKISRQFKVDVLEDKNWVLSTQQKDKPVRTNLFTISQNRLITIFTKKFLQIPASTAFGTGKHYSTFLMIKNIEYLLKKKKFFRFLDLGTGTGILAFILAEIFKKNVTATDIEIESEKCVNRNKKINEINNVFFLKCRSFNSSYFKGKKFNLIVSNILLLPLKNNSKKFYQHLTYGGFVIISGILKSQINDITSHYGKFNLKLVKSIYINEWASIIFKKYGKTK